MGGFQFLKRFQQRPFPKSSFKIPRIQAHRGYTGTGAQENTLNAMVEAARWGAQMAEFDIRMSKDGVPMLQHDEDLQRFYNRPDRISALESVELKKLGMNSLEEVLSAKNTPDFFNIEIKSDQFAWRNPGALERKIIDVIRQCQALERVCISSFDPMILFSISMLEDQIPLAYLYGHTSETRFLSQLALLPFLKVHMLNLDRMLLDERWLKVLNSREIPFSVWTVNDPSEARYFLNNGAMSVISDQNLSGLL